MSLGHSAEYCEGMLSLDLVAGRVGVPQERLSGFESFEAPNPAEWTARGYAIVNVKARGAFDSEGIIRHRFTAARVRYQIANSVDLDGSAQVRDGYDTIEHLATLP